MRTAQVAISAAPAALTIPDGSVGHVRVKNAGANPVFVGDAAVTDTTGYEVAVGEVHDFPLSYGETLYGVCGAALTSTMHVYQT